MKKILLMVFVFSVVNTSAQTFQTWRSEATDNSWQTNGNWWNFPDASPIVFGQQEWDNNHYVEQLNTADISTWRFLFKSQASSTHTFSGNQISFFDYSGNDPSITNESNATHIINNNIIGDDNGDPFFVNINNNGAGGLTFGGNFNNNGSALQIGGSATSAATVTFNGIISGSGALIKDNANITVILNDNNTFTGQLTVIAGTVRLGSSNSSFGNGDIRIGSGGTLDLNGFNVTVASIAEVDANNGGVITLGSGNLTVNQSSGSLYQNSISGTGGIVKQGSGTLSLYGTQSYTGETTVSGGTLSTSVSMSTSNVSVHSGATFTVTANASIASITVESGGVLNIGSNVTLTGDVTVESGGEINNSGSISGTVIYKRALAAHKSFKMLASPVSTSVGDLLAELWIQGQSTGGDTDQGSSNVWTWNSSASGYATSNWTEITNVSSTTLSGASGILVYDYDDDDFSGSQDNTATTLSVSGTEKSAPGTVSVNTNLDGYTLLGNPFASSISWDLISKNNVNTTAHIWTPSGNDAGTWTDVTGTDKIAPFQGFLVRTSNTSSPSITINTSAKTTGATFLGKQALVNEIKFDFNSGETFTKSVRIQIHDDASEGKDFRDAERLAPLAVNYLDAYFSVNDMAFTINSLPELSEAVTIPLHIEFTQSGTVDLTISSFNLPSGYQAMLVDELTGSEYELNGEFTYSFDHVVANKSIAKSPEDVVKSPMLAGVTSSNRFSVVIGPITTSVRELSEVPNAVVLHQNYPNPFNPSTQIAFELPQAMNVSVTVFDMLGREIATLLNGSAKAGYNTVSWNASNVGSGIYYYRLVAGENTITKKMTLVK